jgi:acyl-coenzyme A synthetase/AMP-(fatty) acid ligase
VTSNTTGLEKTASATDRVGNIGTGSVTVKLDKARFVFRDELPRTAYGKVLKRELRAALLAAGGS